MTKQNHHELIYLIKARGWQGAARSFLDIIEPVAPIMSQFLLVMQPMAGIINAQNAIADLAQALDTSDGIETLRQQLDDNE